MMKPRRSGSMSIAKKSIVTSDYSQYTETVMKVQER